MSKNGFWSIRLSKERVILVCLLVALAIYLIVQNNKLENLSFELQMSKSKNAQLETELDELKKSQEIIEGRVSELEGILDDLNYSRFRSYY
jgi:cell division protein FtsB